MAGLPLPAGGMTAVSASARFAVVVSVCGPERAVFALLRMSA